VCVCVCVCVTDWPKCAELASTSLCISESRVRGDMGNKSLVFPEFVLWEKAKIKQEEELCVTHRNAQWWTHTHARTHTHTHTERESCYTVCVSQKYVQCREHLAQLTADVLISLTSTWAPVHLHCFTGTLHWTWLVKINITNKYKICIDSIVVGYRNNESYTCDLMNIFNVKESQFKCEPFKCSNKLSTFQFIMHIVYKHWLK